MVRIFIGAGIKLIDMILIDNKVRATLNFLSLYCLLAMLIACSPRKNADPEIVAPTVDSTSSPLQPADAPDSAILNLSAKILAVLRSKDYQQIATYIHPEDGVRFSPYGFVDTAHDLRFTPAAFSETLQKKASAKLLWGFYDGTGDSIRLTVRQYFAKFVYDVDFLNAEKTSLDSIIGRGNSLINLPKVYPNAVFTESHFSGFDKKYDGMDWRSLRLVYKKKEQQFYLVGIIHDQWTT